MITFYVTSTLSAEANMLVGLSPSVQIRRVGEGLMVLCDMNRRIGSVSEILRGELIEWEMRLVNSVLETAEKVIEIKQQGKLSD